MSSGLVRTMKDTGTRMARATIPSTNQASRQSNSSMSAWMEMGKSMGPRPGPIAARPQHAAPLSHEPLGQDDAGEGVDAGHLGNAAHEAEQQVELPQTVHP